MSASSHLAPLCFAQTSQRPYIQATRLTNCTTAWTALAGTSTRVPRRRRRCYILLNAYTFCHFVREAHRAVSHLVVLCAMRLYLQELSSMRLLRYPQRPGERVPGALSLPGFAFLVMETLLPLGVWLRDNDGVYPQSQEQ